jgi:hypothetical protein
MPFLLDWRKHRTASAGEQAEESNPKNIPGCGTTCATFRSQKTSGQLSDTTGFIPLSGTNIAWVLGFCLVAFGVEASVFGQSENGKPMLRVPSRCWYTATRQPAKVARNRVEGT